MESPELYEVVIPTDRWSIRAVSPFDIRDGLDTSLHPVLVHPGWGKAPEVHTGLLEDLQTAGFLPIGVDTRYGYSDQQIQIQGENPVSRLLGQRYATGITNPYFDVESQAQNRWELRRPTSLLYLCDYFGIGERSYVGHSEGGRIVSLAALAAAELTRRVVLVNAAGTGDSSNGYARLLHSNKNAIQSLFIERQDIPRAFWSTLGSIVYATLHPRRTLQEKRVIQTADLWEVIDQLHEYGVPTSVLHAMQDELISFEDSQRGASLRPWVDFRATEGDHRNLREPAIRKRIVDALLASAVR